MSSDVSPLAPSHFPDLSPIEGVRLVTRTANLRYRDRDDLLLAEFDPGTTVAGVFTSSRCASAPVEWCRRQLPNGIARALVCNAGNANVFTGAAGEHAVEAEVAVIADQLGCANEEVMVASTGVIGEPLDVENMVSELGRLVTSSSVASWETAANAIRTTDTFAKASGADVLGPDGSIVGRIVGIAKGSGMIAPDMATMLSFVFTDLDVSAGAAQQALSASVSGSYNSITVDSDTSTSDTVLLFATAKAGNRQIGDDGSELWGSFTEALDSVNLDLAHQVIRDGEGATKFVTVNVAGAESDRSAKVVARSIADSPLVKTALAAEDANWGRIVMAVGKAGEPADRDRLSITIGDELVAENGYVSDSYSEERATEHLRGDEVVISVGMGLGDGTGTIWTCDLTHGYIDINAGYRS